MNYFEQNRERYLEELKEWLRIPSISTLPEHKPDIRRAAEFAVDKLRDAGLDSVGLIEADGSNPLVYAEWLKAPGKPTVLLYGHYDVQPAEPLDEWKSPPFEPEVRNDNIYARGACDDKGQTLILIKAVEGLLKTTGKLPVNVKVLLEGEEEVGGEHIEKYVASKPPKLKSDVAVVCDTEMFAPELPTICTGLRGMVYTELMVEGADHDLHSGIYGGVAPNPIMAIAEILTALKDREGRILIPGFYDAVEAPSEKELEAWSRLPFNETEYREKEIGSIALTGEPGKSTFEKTWARPTLEVHGIRGGFIGEGAKTVIPARAVAKVSMRLVANQKPQQAFEQYKAAVEKACPKGVKAEVKLIHGAEPSLVDPDNPFVKAAAAALEKFFGTPTVYIRSGGSIPIVGSFERSLGIPSVLMGFGLPDDNLHAPNEKFHLPNFYRGIEAVAGYLEALGK
ncbi:MAG TPA: dipeptidase [Bryobacteraceae bacterium]|nr:dipeptidase [Bryobacteraceae bacterium]